MTAGVSRPGEAGTKNFAGKSESETRNPKQQKTESAKKNSPDVGRLNYFRVRILTLFRNSSFGF
jgi:hypothetical protein